MIEIKNIETTQLDPVAFQMVINKFMRRSHRPTKIIFDNRPQKSIGGNYWYNGKKKQHEIRVFMKVCANELPSEEAWSIIHTLLHEEKHRRQWHKLKGGLWAPKHDGLDSKVERDARSHASKYILEAFDLYMKNAVIFGEKYENFG